MTLANVSPSETTPLAHAAELVHISALLLFLELACIRWFPAHVLFLTFFTNTVLLACFLGMSVGCLAAKRRENLMAWTPGLLGIAMAAALSIEMLQLRWMRFIKVGNPADPQMVYFGAENVGSNAAGFFVPIELVFALFFILITLAMLGPGQELGRALNRVPNRVQAYTLNILGSLAGITLFAVLSYYQFSPVLWFAFIAVGIGYFAHRYRGWEPSMVVALFAIVMLTVFTSRTEKQDGRIIGWHHWSPYYRIDFDLRTRKIAVNLIGHQEMVPMAEPRDYPGIAYELPYLLRRDSGGRPFDDVLVIGAGSGNDVSRALRWGVRRVDAVEIDPAILDLGRNFHPDQPYQDRRVTTHLDDGRNFLRSSDRKYDLIVFALVDSLVLHSSYSNIRLESYLFTTQALADASRHLKPGGVLVIYNYFRQAWIVSRLNQSLQTTFHQAPLVFGLPYAERIDSDTAGGFTMFVAGDTGGLREAFKRKGEYWLDVRQAGPQRGDGFRHPDTSQADGEWVRVGLAQVDTSEHLRNATDDWPFLYLRKPMIPYLNLKGAGIAAGVAFCFLFAFFPKGHRSERTSRLALPMFFLGAGFMLIETKAVVQMALLFGSTWMVNTVVFFAVLLMILAANVLVLQLHPKRIWPYYAGLFISLAFNILVPLDVFLGWGRTLRLAGSCVEVFAPIAFAGVIFAMYFERSTAPNFDFAANIAGAMLGGLSEYCSMLLGFKYLMLVAAAYYAASAVSGRRQPEETAALSDAEKPELAAAP